MSPQTSKKLLKIAAIALSPILLCYGLLIVGTFVPPMQTTSPDGKFSCYIKTSVIPSKLYDSEIRVTDIRSGQTVTATKIYGGVFEEKPIDLIWDGSSNHFIYVYIAEVIGTTYEAFDVTTSPFEVERSSVKEEDKWVIKLLKSRIEKGIEEDVSKELLYKAIHYK